LPTTKRRGPSMQEKSPSVTRRRAPPRWPASAHRVAYGSADIEKLDVYITKQPNAPINVFIHGGAWRTGNAKGAAYMSETFVDAGAHFVSLDFNNVTDVGGNLMIMAEQVRRAIAWVHKNARASAAMPIGSTSRAPRPAVTSPRLRSRPTGRRISDCQPTR
jgi:acetyl esterase/lipase